MQSPKGATVTSFPRVSRYIKTEPNRPPTPTRGTPRITEYEPEPYRFHPFEPKLPLKQQFLSRRETKQRLHLSPKHRKDLPYKVMSLKPPLSLDSENTTRYFFALNHRSPSNHPVRTEESEINTSPKRSLADKPSELLDVLKFANKTLLDKQVHRLKPKESKKLLLNTTSTSPRRFFSLYPVIPWSYNKPVLCQLATESAYAPVEEDVQREEQMQIRSGLKENPIIKNTPKMEAFQALGARRKQHHEAKDDRGYLDEKARAQQRTIKILNEAQLHDLQQRKIDNFENLSKIIDTQIEQQNKRVEKILDHFRTEFQIIESKTSMTNM